MKMKKIILSRPLSQHATSSASETALECNLETTAFNYLFHSRGRCSSEQPLSMEPSVKRQLLLKVFVHFSKWEEG